MGIYVNVADADIGSRKSLFTFLIIVPHTGEI